MPSIVSNLWQARLEEVSSSGSLQISSVVGCTVHHFPSSRSWEQRFFICPVLLSQGHCYWDCLNCHLSSHWPWVARVMPGPSISRQIYRCQSSGWSLWKLQFLTHGTPISFTRSKMGAVFFFFFPHSLSVESGSGYGDCQTETPSLFSLALGD